MIKYTQTNSCAFDTQQKAPIISQKDNGGGTIKKR